MFSPLGKQSDSTSEVLADDLIYVVGHSTGEFISVVALAEPPGFDKVGHAQAPPKDVELAVPKRVIPDCSEDVSIFDTVLFESLCRCRPMQHPIR